jgi:tRNA threonylcarbamoyladenosine dehydratase
LSKKIPMSSFSISQSDAKYLKIAVLSITAFFTVRYFLKYKRHDHIKKSSIVDWDEIENDQEIVQEQLSRNYLFFGDESMDKIRKSFVVIVGLGGVGSHAAVMLARSGVEHIRLIDFDQVTLSSLNRHASATRKDVGISKVLAIKNHLTEIVPHAKIEAFQQLFDINTAQNLLSGKPDFVLDCIDNLETKVDLIAYCLQNKIKILASMGAGAKSDPSRIQIADLSDTFEDPLAK